MTPIYRMVHVDNLSQLLEWEGDLSPAICKAAGHQKRTIHHVDIMDRREQTKVPVGAKGTVADYVPFYFGPKSPMLYSIKQGNVAGYAGQRELIYLVSTAETVEAAGLDFVFTDGHAVIAYRRFFDDLVDLTEVPWKVVRAKYWNDYIDGRFKRQAEFLVRDRFPWSCVEKIAVYDDAMKLQVEEQLRQKKLEVEVRIERNWYF